ncbi:MAG: thioredoxin domain-containing protein [Pseudomonadota bacterium]
MRKRIIGSISTLAFLIGAGAAARPSQSLDPQQLEALKEARGSNWHTQITPTARGHLIGNPKAEARLIAFVSYSCTECAQFARQAYAPLNLALLAPGKLSYEIRPRVGSQLDLTVALLAGCGQPNKFRRNHTMFLQAQDVWLERYKTAPGSQRAFWQTRQPRARASLANALDFDEMMARRRGYSRTEVQRCLTDTKNVARLRANSEADEAEFDLPDVADNRLSFALDGKVLAGVHDWRQLYPILTERFASRVESN